MAPRCSSAFYYNVLIYLRNAIHGADDPLVPKAQVDTFENEMRQAKVDWQLTEYGGAVHSFTNPEAGNDVSKGVAYNATADRRSFADMQQFFAELFAVKKP